MKRMNKMTETEVLAASIASALDSEPSTWGKAQAESAINFATKLMQKGKCDAGEFARAVARLGNHSATRQHLEKHGFLSPDKDALAKAIEAAQGETARLLGEIAA